MKIYFFSIHGQNVVMTQDIEQAERWQHATGFTYLGYVETIEGWN